MLKTLSACLVAAIAMLTSSSGLAATKVEVGYMPILPLSQLFVALENGAFEDAGIEPDLVKFQQGPAMVQALLAGQLDVAYFGIGPAMVARAKGADIKVVASNIVEQISFVASPDLAPFFEGGAKTAFARFAEEKGRKPVISTFPVGSVPETVLQYWLRRQLGIDPDEVEIVYQGAAQVQQSLLTGAVDGAAILEPIVTVVSERLPDAKVVARGAEMFPNQPGAVLAVREGLIAEHPDLVQALVDAHRAATDALNADPAGTAPAVQTYVGGGRLAVETVEKALRSSAGSFVADPDQIVDGTREMQAFQKELGTVKGEVSLDELFEPRFFRAGS